MAVYKVIEKLGEGGMGVVYKAIQRPLDREVALKVMLESVRDDGNAMQRFVREVRASSRVSHRNIIKVLDYGELEGQPYYAMEFMPHGTLKDLIQKGPLPIPQVVKLARQLLDALSCIHGAGLVHRDLKPANIMVDGRDHVTLMDFGLVKDLRRTALTEEGHIVGTPTYLAPEVILGNPTDGRADLFALGIVLYEALTNRKPFQGQVLQVLLKALIKDAPEPLAKHRPDCPEWLAGCVGKLLEKSPDSRYPSAKACLVAIQQALGETAGPADDDLSMDLVVPAREDELDAGAPVPQGSIEGGIGALRAALQRSSDEADTTRDRDRPTTRSRPVADLAGSPRPGRSPARSPTRPVRRITSTVPAIEAPDRRSRLVVGVALGAVSMVALALLVWPRHGARPPAPPPSPLASRASPRPTPSAAPPVDPVSTGLLLARAIRSLDPASQLKLIHKDLLRIPKTRWFTRTPSAEMLALRRDWAARLTQVFERTGLPGRAAAFRPVKEEYFAGPRFSPPLASSCTWASRP